MHNWISNIDLKNGSFTEVLINMIHPMKEFLEQYTKEYNMDMSYPNPSFAALVCKKKLEFALQNSRRRRQSIQGVSY